MMWAALIHSYMVANPRDQTFHMADWRFRQDAVAKVENERVSSERFEDGVGRAIERRSAGEQHQRIEIALNGTQRLNVVTRKIQFRHPIEPHRINRHSIQIALQLGARAAWEAYDSRRWNVLTHAGYNPRHRLDTPFTEFIGRQHTRPGIEDLHGIDAGRKLFDQVAHRSLDQNFDELREGLRMP